MWFKTTNISSIKNERGMNDLWLFPWEKNFLCHFCCVRIKGHFLLLWPFVYTDLYLDLQWFHWHSQQQKIRMCHQQRVYLKNGRSLIRGKIIYVKRKNNGPNIDPWGTPELILFQLEACPFNITLWYLPDKKLSISLNNSPFIPLYLSLYISPSCHILSNALKISRNTPRTSREELQPKTYISWVTHKSC